MKDFKRKMVVDGKDYVYYSIKDFGKEYGIDLDRLPISIKILLENLIRNFDNKTIDKKDILSVANWKKNQDEKVEIAYNPFRVVMQDFTGVPAVVDLAAMRDAVVEASKSPSEINPVVQTDLVIDHSVQVDYFGSKDAYEKNLALEYERNGERYKLLKWAQGAFSNFRIVPPGAGIIHQVNLEYLAYVAAVKEVNGEKVILPDTLIGTDSHTTMINGLGILGWGVGGIEAEAVMTGQPYYMAIPEVVGVRLFGKLAEGVTTTDLVLSVTEILRKESVVEKFVEFFGPALKTMSLPDRATLSNMAPEYGATCGFFPVDRETVDYLKLTGREAEAFRTEQYFKEQNLFYNEEIVSEFTKTVEIDLGSIKPSVAGPKRPQDKIVIEDLKISFNKTMEDFKVQKDMSAEIEFEGKKYNLNNGSVVIAAITSCTNTSNPSVMIGAGLLAKKAVELGLSVKPFIKTSLAPGSGVVTGYLEKAGLLSYLEKLRFNIVGYGCTTCIGNSGPLPEPVRKPVVENDMIVSSVLSGNRNFEARINQYVKTNYLASPPLVIAYAIAGKMDIDLTKEPLGFNSDGPVYLKDIWPTSEEINNIIKEVISPELFKEKYSKILDGDENWQKLEIPQGETFYWEKSSTYIQQPPFFKNLSKKPEFDNSIDNARVLLYLGDSVTTDHISPAGAIPENYPAGQYLNANNQPFYKFNTYGSRRGNHQVMMRGTFANVRIKNKLSDEEGGLTTKLPEGTKEFVFDAAEKYKKENTPLIVIGGKEYGTGSSRDWAAKGTFLLGIKAVIAESYERIHRSNLVGMGVLPLQFENGTTALTLGLTGKEVFSIKNIDKTKPGGQLEVIAKTESSEIKFNVKCRLDTDIEVEYWQNGGILQTVLRSIMYG